MSERVPGYEGSIGPGPKQYHLPHVYARSIYSGSGNCVCGMDLGHERHTEAAPGVPVPEHRRHRKREDGLTGLDRVQAAVRAVRGGDPPAQVRGFA